MTSERNVVVILAGGVGRRMGTEVPKQLLEVAGRTILEHTVAAFESHPAVDEIVLAIAQGHLGAVRTIVRRRGQGKVVDIIEGGATRTETTTRALAAIRHEHGNVLLHDAVRPLVTHRIITDCFEALTEHAAVAVVLPTALFPTLVLSPRCFPTQVLSNSATTTRTSGTTPATTRTSGKTHATHASGRDRPSARHLRRRPALRLDARSLTEGNASLRDHRGTGVSGGARRGYGRRGPSRRRCAPAPSGSAGPASRAPPHAAPTRRACACAGPRSPGQDESPRKSSHWSWTTGTGFVA